MVPLHEAGKLGPSHLDRDTCISSYAGKPWTWQLSLAVPNHPTMRSKVIAKSFKRRWNGAGSNCWKIMESRGLAQSTITGEHSKSPTNSPTLANVKSGRDSTKSRDLNLFQQISPSFSILPKRTSKFRIIERIRVMVSVFLRR